MLQLGTTSTTGATVGLATMNLEELAKVLEIL